MGKLKEGLVEKGYIVITLGTSHLYESTISREESNYLITYKAEAPTEQEAVFLATEKLVEGGE